MPLIKLYYHPCSVYCKVPCKEFALFRIKVVKDQHCLASNRMNSLLTCLLLAGLSASTNQLFAQTGGPNKGTINTQQVDQLFTPFIRPDGPGAVIAIVKEGKMVYSKGYGNANLEYNLPNAASTVFHAASISKQFTAFAVAVLASQGKLSLDDDVRKYLPEVADFGPAITIRHLIYHTSGLRDQWGLLSLAGWRSDDVITQEQILKLIYGQRELNFMPGTEFLYSNTNYTLLAQIVEQVTGQPFSTWTRKHIFEPLGMKHTLFNDSHERVVKNRADSYQELNMGYKKSVLNYATVGATGLLTTAEDLARWAIQFEQTKLIHQAVFAQLSQSGVLGNGQLIQYSPQPGSSISYGYGQAITQYKGLRLVYHDGSDAGFRTYLGRFPDQHFAVVVLSNLGSFDAEKIALQVADLYLTDRPVEKRQSQQARPQAKEAIDASYQVGRSVLKTYVGRYKLSDKLMISIWQQGKGLKGQITGKKTVHDLVAESDTSFTMPMINASVVFKPAERGQANYLTFRYDQGVASARRVEMTASEQAALRELTGTYFSHELGTAYTIVLRDDELIVQHPRLSDIHLTVLEANRLSGDVGFFKDVELIRGPAANVAGFKVSNGRVRNLWFEKR